LLLVLAAEHDALSAGDGLFIEFEMEYSLIVRWHSSNAAWALMPDRSLLSGIFSEARMEMQENDSWCSPKRRVLGESMRSWRTHDLVPRIE
jgi:hypothetical protein